MARVYLSIGSNIDRDLHIVASLDALAEQFIELDISSVYESEAVGFSGDHFYNLVAGFDTGMSVGELSVFLRKIEHENGRNRGQERFSARTLDIDILLYDECVGVVDGVSLPRAEILENAFVLLPLSEIAPERAHPVQKKAFSILWQSYDRPQKLWPVDFIWREQQISRCAGSV